MSVYSQLVLKLSTDYAKASILSESGGTCVCSDPTLKAGGCQGNSEYNNCLIGKSFFPSLYDSNQNRYQERPYYRYGCHSRHQLSCFWVSYESSSSVGVSTFSKLFSLLKLRIISPGMGLNAYFTFQVVGQHGAGKVSYQLALTAVFVEGFIFVFLSLIGMRQWLVKIIPASVKVASGVGIGMFLTMIGLSYSGIGLITGANATPTDLGGCPPQYLDPDSGACLSHKMTNPTVLSTRAHRILLPADRSIDVDWYNLWWSPNRFPHVLPSQISHHHRHRGCLYNVLAP